MKFWQGILAKRLVQLGLLALAFIVLAGGLVFVPTAWKPYVRVPGNTIALPLDCIASDLHIWVRTNHLELRRAELVLRDLSGSAKAGRFSFSLPDSITNDELHLALPQSQQGAALEYLSQRPQGGVEASATIEFTRVPRIDLDAIEVIPSPQHTMRGCKRQRLEFDPLQSALKADKAELVHYRRPQDLISEAILQANDLLGSLVLAGMVVISGWLLVATSAGFVQAYVSGEKSLQSMLKGARRKSAEAGLTVADAQIVRNRFHFLERRFMFWRVVGPALGFILTISSLVEGLHPSRQGSQNSFLLISALQLALVATFVGLWIRILAECAIRLHRTAAEKRLALLTADSSKGHGNER